MKLSFVIPIYNEEKTLKTILKKVEKVELEGVEKEFVLVNDFSTDGTQKILSFVENRNNYIVLHNEENLGKSQSVKKGIIHTTGDLVVIQDADLEYDPEDLKPFIRLFKDDKVDLVYGNRFGKKNKVIYWQNWIGNTTLSLISSIITYIRSQIWTRDMEVCYKMSKGEIFREIAPKIKATTGFGLEPELTARFSKYKIDGKHLRYQQIPINYKPRSVEEGKHLNAYKDGLKALFEIFRYNFLEK